MSVYISNCEDPAYVEVNVDYTNEDLSDYHEFYYYFNQSETVNNEYGTYSAIVERNSSFLGFMVSIEEIRWVHSRMHSGRLATNE